MTAPAPRVVRWRYHFTDIRSGRLKATLPLRGASFDEALGGVSDGGGEINLHDPSARDVDVYDATLTRRTALWAVREIVDPRARAVVGVSVPWGGVVTRRQRSLVGRSLSLTAVSWAGYFARRLTPTLTYNDADLLTIARGLVASGIGQRTATYPTISPHHQPLALPGIGHVPMSGVLVDRSYRAADLKPVLDNLTELSGASPSFDWRFVPYMRVAGDLSTLAVRLDLGYPRLGRIEPPNVKWRTPVSPEERGRAGILLGGTLAEDGTAADNELTGLGSGSGPTQLRSVRTADQAGIPELAAGYPLYQGVLRGSTTDLRTQARLDAVTEGAVLSGLASEVRVSGIKVRGDLAPDLSSYEVGDDATLELAEGLSGEPTTIVGQIIGRKIAPPESGSTETVDLDLQGTTTVVTP